MKLLALAAGAQVALFGAVEASTTCSPESYGDGWCDEHNNHANCEYDHGDCCMEVRGHTIN